MKTLSRSNNLVAILIALLLFAIGFVLYFVHEQTQSDDGPRQTRADQPTADVVLSAPTPCRPGARLCAPLLGMLDIPA